MPWPVHPNGLLGAQGDQDTYRIERSLRFNSADSAYLNRTPASAGNRKTWTWSGWVKRSSFSSNHTLFSAGSTSTNATYIQFQSSGSITVASVTSNVNSLVKTTSSLYRDPSSYYHICVAVDTSNSTSTDRCYIYVNGVKITSFSSSTDPTLNYDTFVNNNITHAIGAYSATLVEYFDGYLTEINFIDGQALTPSSFGETDPITGRWKAKAYSGTYGTNGFYLKFADNSGTTATTLGKDSSGNGNNWTPNNFSVTAGAGNDSLVDSPTNYGTDTGVGGEVRGNYATLNPISNLSGTYSNGNLDFITATSDSTLIANIAMNSGKWYCETIKTSGTAIPIVGICSSFAKNGFAPTNTNQHPSVVYLGNSGNKVINGTSTSYGSTYTTNDVIGIAFDADTREIVFYKNGISQGIITGVPSGEVVFCVGDGDSVNTYSGNVNFGQRPFAYTAPSGFKALCTTNLPTPTIKKPSSYMDVVTYTGNNSARSITGLNFSPDLVWIKSRSAATWNFLFDAVRGATKWLASNQTGAEATNTTSLTSFDSGGFSLSTDPAPDTSTGWNANSATYVAWAWDEAPIAGMDIVSFTAPSTNQSYTVSHSLGVAPKMTIVKRRDSTGGWWVWHSGLGDNTTDYLELHTTAAKQTATSMWGTIGRNSSSIGLNSPASTVASATYIAYLFAEVEGFSKFGSYTGNGLADGPFVWCGFRPRWVMVKRTDTAGFNWVIWDTARSTSNQVGDYVLANAANAENNVLGIDIDALSNGFKLRDYDAANSGNTNISTATYIFAAFAESPFKYARAR
jgi:Concanavalin A-like lectin/glucanases superfamily/SPRY domain